LGKLKYPDATWVKALTGILKLINKKSKTDIGALPVNVEACYSSCIEKMRT